MDATERAVRDGPLRPGGAPDQPGRGAVGGGGDLLAPTPPHFDVRTPEYAGFDEIQATPFELVRGMDRSFAHNEQSRPEDFISRQALLTAFVDAVAKGGNLLLNVGPRGTDATIPDAQLDRLRWIGAFLDEHRDAVVGTRPWVVAGTVTHEGDPLRYTARGEDVFAFVRPSAGATSATLGEIAPTATTTVCGLDGTSLRWRATGAGLQVDLPATEPPAVLALGAVAVRPGTS